MSFKTIDMSMAVHKNTEAAQVQRELSHKPSADQAALAQSGMKTDAELRHKTVRLEETDKSKVRDNPQGQGRNGQTGREGDQTEGASESKNRQAKQPDPLHPYKGHHIDLSL